MTHPKLKGIDSPTAIPSQYIVIFKADANAQVSRDNFVSTLSGEDKLMHKYDIGSMVGFAAVLTKPTLERALAEDAVDYVEFDQVVQTCK
eukprot:TRINITY_DN4648_c0_g1_i1.p1 TRINITY_DN4648_c0_g1~~TRINITY_DN4648_c0_g1_i1.p1  ORF type:complete len:100 (-),score=20.85 TRINITY_DN4648_c0_g1_i1:82-351(-)